MTELEEKAAYAALLLRYPKDPFKAALELHPSNTNRALFVANYYPIDPDVLRIKKDLLAKNGKGAYMPDKHDLAEVLWSRIESNRISNEDLAKLGKLYADINGFIEKPSNNVNINTNVDNRVVMVIPHMGTGDEWERNALEQQRNLVNVCSG